MKTLKHSIIAAVMLFGLCNTAGAHTLEYFYNRNIDGTYTFNAGTSVHSGDASAGTGFLFNGNAVSFDNETFLSDATWDAMRDSALDSGAPSSFDSTSIGVMIDVTLDLATLTTFGLTFDNTFQIDTFDSPLTRWASIGPASMTFLEGSVSSDVPEPITFALMGLGLIGLKLTRRK